MRLAPAETFQMHPRFAQYTGSPTQVDFGPKVVPVGAKPARPLVGTASTCGTTNVACSTGSLPTNLLAGFPYVYQQTHGYTHQ